MLVLPILLALFQTAPAEVAQEDYTGLIPAGATVLDYSCAATGS